MIHRPVRDWLSQVIRSSRHRRQRADSARRYRSRLALEPLEGRWVPSTVTNLNDAGAGSLRQAIIDTPVGGTVDFQQGLSGTITLTTGELAVSKNLTITGPGAGVITVSGNHSSRVFDINGMGIVDISGLTIADASNSGIYDSGTLTLSNCVVSGNSASLGGGLEVYGGMVMVTNSTLNDNSASLGGGGIYNLYGTVTVTNSVLSGNSVSGTGGGGGGIDSSFATLIVTNSTLSDNSALREGGGISIDSSTVTITSSTLSGNSAIATPIADGGGIYNSGKLTITNSTLSGNRATGGTSSVGGGIFNNNFANLTITNSTVSGNSAGTSAGGIESSTGTAANIILAGNTAFFAPDIGGPLNSQGYNLIGNGTGGSGFTNTDLVGTADQPIDPLLGPLQNNGGPTPTMALLAGSPALNAGDPAQLGAPDQRGVIRTGGVNIGAYQASATTLVLTAPATVTSGVPFTLAVAPVDPFGQPAIGYTGTVTFSTSDGDPAVVLPTAYTFQPGPRRGAFFPGGATLITAGDQTITATDTSDNTLTGSATVTVTSTNGSPQGRPAPAPNEPTLSVFTGLEAALNRHTDANMDWSPWPS